LISKLPEFERHCESLSFKKLDHLMYAYEIGAPKTLSLGAIVHGNEIGGLEVMLKLLSEMKNGLKPHVNIRFLLGNLWAYEANKRLLTKDMNRSFLLDHPESQEEKRAAEILKHVQGSDVMLDLHQTIEPTKSPFFAFNFSEKNYLFARSLSDMPVVCYKAFSGLSKGVGLANAATKMGMVGMTIETGEKGIFEEQTKLGFELVLKTISILEGKASVLTSAPVEKVFTWGSTVNNPDFSLHLVKQWRNFDEVTHGEILAKSSEHSVTSPISGPVLFPKYGENQKHSLELIRVLKPVHQWSDLD
jgi:succinylglutamate desuccinylase